MNTMLEHGEKIKVLVVLLVQQGHYWSFLRAEPFCAGFGGFSVWGKLLGYPISCHVIFPLQRYVISGRLYLEGNFVRIQYFTLGDVEENKEPGVWGVVDWLGCGGKYYCGWGGEGINSGSGDQSQGCIMVSVREGLAGRKLSFLLLFHIFIVILNLFYYYHFIFYRNY